MYWFESCRLSEDGVAMKFCTSVQNSVPRMTESFSGTESRYRVTLLKDRPRTSTLVFIRVLAVYLVPELPQKNLSFLAFFISIIAKVFASFSVIKLSFVEFRRVASTSLPLILMIYV